MIVRRATDFDGRQMAALLNKIIQIGGTTAHISEISADELNLWRNSSGADAAWFVAESATGEIVGFQWIEPKDGLPPEACDISTFVQVGQTGLGIGSALFEVTKDAAIRLGYDWINANIRADNQGGLTYYQSRGFRVWDRKENVTLENGQTVSKVLKRYDLRD